MRVRIRVPFCSVSSRLLFLAVLALLTLLAHTWVSPSAWASPLTERRAQAREVKQQVEELNQRLSIAVEEYNLASIRLAAVRQRIKTNSRRLAEARLELAVAKDQLSRRVVLLYKQRPTDLLDVLLQTRTVDELLTELNYMTALGRSDAELIASIRSYEREIRAKREQLVAQRRDARRLVAQRVERKRAITAELQERKRQLAGVQEQVRRLEAAAVRAARQAAERAARAAQAASAGPSQTVEGAATAAGDGHPEAVTIARRYLGIPYLWGGASPSSGFDCSGLTMYVYAQLGISLPHAASQQYNYGTRIYSRADLRPGDLVFFGPSAAGIYHVGIYAGGGSMINAPYTGAVVRYDSVGSSYFGAVRL